MIKKIVGIGIAILLLSGMMGIGTWAYFSDFETVTDNIFAAGTLLLTTDDANGVSETLFAANLAPGATIGPKTIMLANAGSIDASKIDFIFNYVEADAFPNPINNSADATAGQLEVTTLSYGGTSILGGISDLNSNGYIDMHDLKNSDLSGLAGIAANSSKAFTITVQLKADTPAGFQNDGIEITMTFILTQ